MNNPGLLRLTDAHRAQTNNGPVAHTVLNDPRTADLNGLASGKNGNFVLNLSEFWQLIYRGLWIIAACGLIGGLIAVYSVLQITPTYGARSQVLLGQQSRADDTLGNLFQGLDLDSKLIAGEVAIMSSGRILSRVAQRLELGAHPEFNPALRPPPKSPSIVDRSVEAIKTGLKTVMGADVTPDSGTDSGSTNIAQASGVDPVTRAASAEREVLGDQADFVGQIEAGLSIRQVGSTPLVNIAYYSTDPMIAAAVVNTIADEYIAFQLEEKLSSARRATEGLNNRIDGLRDQLEKSERDVIDFRDQMLGADLAGSERLEQQIRELSTRLIEVSTAHAELRAELSEVDRLTAESGIRAAAVVLDSPTIQELQGHLAGLRSRAMQMTNSFGDENPRLTALRTEILRFEDALNIELKRQRDELAGRTAVASAREASVRQQLRDMEQRYLTLSQELVRLSQLEREAEANRLVYETFLTTFTQTNAVVGLQEADARVVTYAKPPTNPAAPNKKVSVAMGVVAGLLAGLGIVFLRAINADTIDSPEKLRRVMGHVPVVTTMPMLRRFLGRADPLNPPKGNDGAKLQEAVRLLRNSLMLRRKMDNRKLTIISAEPGEAKTTTTLLVAQASVRAGRSCVVVETDLRRGSIARILNKPDSPDIVDVLTGKASLDSALRFDETIGAHVVVARSGVADPASLLLSDNMRLLVRDLEQRFNLIIFDTPPLLSVSDALPILKYSDDVIMVVRWKKSTYEKVGKCLAMLREANISLTYAVMTMAKGKTLESYGNYYGTEPSVRSAP